MCEIIENFRFTPDLLAPSLRTPGISAFMRIRNGADFLEATIRTHAGFYDEIVAVYNQCDDATPEILARLSSEMGPRLRVFHYAPRVHPAGSAEHAQTPGSSPHSLVNYSNFALAQTRHRWAVKLDDDHLAIPAAVRSMVDRIRAEQADDRVMHCFSGLNLARSKDGGFGVPAEAPVSGGGDIGYFRVTDRTHFVEDPRFERFSRGELERRFAGWFYWHLKFLKSGGGFANYELEANPQSRYVRRRDRRAGGSMIDLPELRRALDPGWLHRIWALADPKARLAVARDASVAEVFPHDSLISALDATSPEWRRWLEPAR